MSIANLPLSKRTDVRVKGTVEDATMQNVVCRVPLGDVFTGIHFNPRDSEAHPHLVNDRGTTLDRLHIKLVDDHGDPMLPGVANILTFDVTCTL